MIRVVEQELPTFGKITQVPAPKIAIAANQ